MLQVIRLWLVFAFVFLTTACELENNLFSFGALACFVAAGIVGAHRLRNGNVRGTREAFGGITWALFGAISLYVGCLLSWPFPAGPAVALTFFAVAIVLGVRKDRLERSVM